jgi:hypothetical protein
LSQCTAAQVCVRARHTLVCVCVCVQLCDAHAHWCVCAWLRLAFCGPEFSLSHHDMASANDSGAQTGPSFRVKRRAGSGSGFRAFVSEGRDTPRDFGSCFFFYIR